MIPGHTNDERSHDMSIMLRLKYWTLEQQTHYCDKGLHRKRSDMDGESIIYSVGWMPRDVLNQMRRRYENWPLPWSHVYFRSLYNNE